MAEVSAKIMEKNNLKAEDVTWLAAHQANKRIIDATSSRMGIGPDKVMMNIERYGNTTAGTIPLAACGIMRKQLKKEIIYYSLCFWRRIYLGRHLS